MSDVGFEEAVRPPQTRLSITLVSLSVSIILKMANFKVAAVQAAPVSFDLEKSLVKLEKITKDAAEAGANLVVFP